MVGFLERLVDPNKKRLAQLEKKVKNVLVYEEKFSKLSDIELREKTDEFKKRLNKGETLDDILAEAFATAREAAFRVLGMKPFPVQLMGGIVLHEGDIAEMKTGEGKTLVATLPAYLNALTGEGVYVITVNEYLAKRDREIMGQVFEFLGLKVGLILNELSPLEKKEAYECDITYGTNSEFGFDYLRDNMVISPLKIVQRSLNYCIIDEIDSVLIDEARTPLIISGQGDLPSEYYEKVNKFTKSLKKKDYEIDYEKRSIELTEKGLDKVELFFNLDDVSDAENAELLHHIRKSMYATYMMKKNQDYVVKKGEVLIVDQFTGRIMPGRRYNDGLHQAIEAKEHVEIQKESKTLATITYQNFFRMFNKISGMTGTAYTEKDEFLNIYNMDTVAIPTNRPVIRMDKPDLIFKTSRAKRKAIIDEVEKRYKLGQPILLGTTFIDESEKLSKLLTRKGIKHRVLNAKQDADEAKIIERAGEKGAVTIATNMAGRGTDIKLGEGVEELGGLLVLGTEKHESRRIDNQLRGRSGRQGDPGESQFYISLEDRIFEKVSERQMNNIKKNVNKLISDDSESINISTVKNFVEKVQKTIELTNFEIRKHTLDFDSILNNQRKDLYDKRNAILKQADISELVKDILKKLIDNKVKDIDAVHEFPENWDLIGLQKYLDQKLEFKGRVNLTNFSKEEIEDLTKDKLKETILNEAFNIYEEKEENLGKEKIRYIERLLLMEIMDRKWMDHLDILDQIKQGVGLQSIGHEKPIRVYNREAFNLYQDMFTEIHEDFVKCVFALAIKEEKKEKPKVVKKEVIPEKKVQNVKLFSNKIAEIKFKLAMDEYKEDNIKADLLYNGKKLADFEIPIKKGHANVRLTKGEKDWNKGLYQLELKVNERNIKVPFMIVKEFKKDAEDILVNFNLNNPKEERLNLQGELIHLFDNTNGMRLPIQINKSGNYNIKLQQENDWRPGPYEFRVKNGDELLFTDHFLVS